MFGTAEFVAPEVINYEQISFATDLWSVGVVAYLRYRLRSRTCSVLEPSSIRRLATPWTYFLHLSERSCPRLDVVHPGRAWSSWPACTWHCSLHYLFLHATPFSTPICTKSFVGCGFAPDPTGAAYSAPPDHLAVFRGPASKGRREERRG